MLGSGLNFITHASAECFTPKDPTLHSGSGIADSIHHIPMLPHTASLPRSCPGAPHPAPGMDTQLSPDITRRCYTCVPSPRWDAGGSAIPASSPMPVGPTPMLPMCSHAIFQGSRKATPHSLHTCVSTHIHTYLQTETCRFMDTERS